MRDLDATRRRIKHMQTEAEFQSEIGRSYRDNGKIVQAKNKQVLAAYWSQRARDEMVTLMLFDDAAARNDP